ncbi:MAG: hypothetical protein JST59_00340 [Actinobacteria bacterium]|nr:hypothetical protein [Actinomycetota bacterium]
MNYIMREEIEVLEMHKSLIEAQKMLYNDELRLYNDVLQEDKSNEEFLGYAECLEGLVDRRMGMLANLRDKLASYKYHLKEHELCEKKLFRASEKFVQAEQPPNNEEFLAQFEFQLPSARLFQHNNFVNPTANFNSQPSTQPQQYTGNYCQSGPYHLGGYQPQLLTQPSQKSPVSPYISDFSGNQSYFDRLGIQPPASQLYQNKSDCY